MTDTPRESPLPDDTPLSDAWRYESSNAYTQQVHTFKEAQEDLPPVTHIVKGLITAGSLGLWFGAPGSLKSMLLMDLAICVAAGIPWLQDEEHKFPGYEVTQCGVLWVDVDNGRDLTHERIQAISRAHGLNMDDIPFYWHSFPTPPLSAASGLNTFIDHVLDLEAGLVAADNLLRIAGVDDENSSKMDSAMVNLRKVCEVTHAGFPVVHHKRKETMGRDGDSIRGHSSIEGAIDSGYMVARVEGQDVLTVKQVKARRRPAKPFSATFKYALKDDGETLHSARMFSVPTVDMQRERMEQLAAKVLSFLTKTSLANKAQITEWLKLRRETVNELLDNMELAGQVETMVGPHNSTLYRVKV